MLDTNQAVRRLELEVRADQLGMEVRELRSRVQWQHLMAGWAMQTVPGTGSRQSAQDDAASTDWICPSESWSQKIKIVNNEIGKMKIISSMQGEGGATAS